VTVQGGELTVDCDGSEPQFERGGINVVFSMTEATTFFTLSSLLIPQAPNASGAYLPIQVKVPSSSILNTKFPDACFVRTCVARYLPTLSFRDLSSAVPDRIISSTDSGICATVNGILSGDGAVFNAWIFGGGGMGVNASEDGIICLLFPTSGSNVPIEIFENRTPLLINQKALLLNSGGSGKFRDGLGQGLTVRPAPGQEQAITLSILGPDIMQFPAEGFLGGEAGAPGRVVLRGRALGNAGDEMGRGVDELGPEDELTI